jgi:2-oxoglutarate ferredoxin oxidoreductase subunit gamma
MSDKNEKEILVTGFGGQGIIMTGNILGTAATIYDKKHATMTQAYGPEARGGACSSQVIISNEEILFPYVEQPEVLICMSQEGYSKNVKSLVSDGTLIWDTDLVQPGDLNPRWTAYNIPATRFAEELGNKMMANIVILGFLSATSDMVSPESLREAVLDSVPKATMEKNAQAFDHGREYGKTILKSVVKRRKSAKKG